MNRDQEQWRHVQDMLRGYRTAQVLMACAELGLFELMATGPQTAAALAAAAQCDSAGLTRLLNAAVSLDLLTKRGDRYANAPLAESTLVAGRPHYLGHLIRREGAFYRRWGFLTDAVRTGQRPEANTEDENQGNWVLDFELALYDLARVFGPVIAEALALPADQLIKVLDVGGGHGGYSMALAARYANVAATVFELPAAAAVARELISQAGMSNRIAVQDGDFQKEGLGTGYDLLLLFGVLVSESPDQKVALLRKSYAALNPGGSVVIREFWLDEERTGPSPGPLFSLHMLLSTDKGELSTISEMSQWIYEAGFRQLEPVDIPAWAGSDVYRAYK